jgi:hypothetical protein
MWWPCLLMDRDEMSSLYRGPPIDASYQVSVNQKQELKFIFARKNVCLPPSHKLVKGKKSELFANTLV